jgi:hypothetical protein
MPSYIVVNNARDLSDSYAGTTEREALDLAAFDHGTVVQVRRVEARDAGEARMAYTIHQHKCRREFRV